MGVFDDTSVCNIVGSDVGLYSAMVVGCDVGTVVGTVVGTEVNKEQEVGQVFKFVKVSTANES